MTDEQRCGGTGMVAYWDGSAYAGEMCRGCLDCEPPDGDDWIDDGTETKRPGPGAVSDEVSAIDPIATERPQEALRATNLPPVAPVEQERQENEFHLLREMRAYLDTLTIHGDNIGDIRRSLFMPWDSLWNGWVRDETAERESASPSVVSEPRREQERQDALRAALVDIARAAVLDEEDDAS